MSEINLYTDGGCIGNPGKGAWAYVLQWDSNEHSASGGDKATTNNRMELSAVINGLNQVKNDTRFSGKAVTVHTDSQYVKNGITQWIYNWEKNNWKTAAKEPVKNQDLWKELKALADVVKPHWTWVKGHSGHPQNEQCDSLVRATMEKI